MLELNYVLAYITKLCARSQNLNASQQGIDCNNVEPVYRDLISLIDSSMPCGQFALKLPPKLRVNLLRGVLFRHFVLNYLSLERL